VSLPKPPSKPITIQPGDRLWAPEDSPLALTMTDATFSWGPLDDVVMGGASSSTFNNKIGQWTGSVTDANSGGFVGIRTTPFNNALDMSSCKGIEFTLKNLGGKQLKAVARDSTDFNGVCWTNTFGGNSKWGLWKPNSIGEQTKIQVPFGDAIPTIFARTVPDQVLKKDNIVGFQLVYSKFLFDGQLNPDFTVGDFSIDVVDMKAY
jgi:hypothetical protein